jgi:hypothetical protein
MQYIIPSYKEIEDYFLLNFKISYIYDIIEPSLIADAFHHFNGDIDATLNNIYHIEPKYFNWKKYKVPVFIFDENFKGQIIEDNKISFDIFLNAFLFLSGWQEWKNEKKDAHGRFPYFESLQYKHKFTLTPVVNIYFEILAEHLIMNGHRIEKKTWDGGSQIILTHDIDQIKCGYREDCAFLLKNFKLWNTFKIIKILFRKFFLCKDTFQEAFEEMIEFEKSQKLSSIYFLMSSKEKKDSDYSLGKKLKRLTKTIVGNTSVIGLHGGYFTAMDEQELSRQKTLLEKFTESEISKTRQHFLRYDSKITNGIHEKVGFTEDYTLGFAEYFGFRNSIATPFHLFNFENGQPSKVLQIPLFMMDTTILRYMICEPETNFDLALNNIASITEDINICFSVLFHNNILSKYKFKAYNRFYPDFIKFAKSNSISLKNTIQ